MTYTIKEIADLAGVITRTLRYYDHLGLLPPAKMGENGYRYYDQASLLSIPRCKGSQIRLGNLSTRC